jgi:hypothetical protein
MMVTSNSTGKREGSGILSHNLSYVKFLVAAASRSGWPCAALITTPAPITSHRAFSAHQQYFLGESKA